MMDVVDLTQELIRAAGGSGDESAAADVVERSMLALGYRDVARTRLGSVIGVIGPSGELPSVLFDGHLDVVPVAGKWSVDPFGAEIIDGRLYGRGATDMKGGLAAAVTGAAAASRSGRLQTPVAVSATVLEETVEGVALAEVLDILRPLHVVICEPSDLQIQVGQRGRAEIQLTAEGVPAHAAHPDRGVNANMLLARALVALESLEPTRDPLLGAGILVPTDIITSPYPSISMLPESVRARLDRRTVTGESLSDVISSIQHVVGRVDPNAFRVEVTADEVICYTGHREKPERFLASWVIDPHHPLVRAARRACEHVLGQFRLGVYGFCTNGSESAGRRGLPTIGLGPGREEDAHTADESVSVEQVRRAADIYEQISLEMGRQ